MAGLADFGEKLDLVLKALNMSRARVAQLVGIDKSVVSRWTTGTHAPTNHNLSLLTEVVARHRADFKRLDWELDLPAFAARLGVGPIAPPATDRALPSLPDRPSLAVLPFDNLGGNPDEDYFADGIVEDIITALSRFQSLFVIARNSSFRYKGTSPDIREVGRELGVQYVLEGSVRKAGNRVRLTGQLIDVVNGVHLWAERYDGALEDIFDLQDRITSSVVGAVAPTVERAERERVRRKSAENLDAYDSYLRGMARYYEHTKEACDEALRFFYRAIELDPRFATPYGMAARCYADRKWMSWAADPDAEAMEIRRLADGVSRVGRDDALALTWAAFTLVWMCREYEKGAGLADRAVVLNPNLAVAWINRAFISIYFGEHELAIQQLLKAERLDPMDPEFVRLATSMSWAHMLLGRNAEAQNWAAKAFSQRSDWMAAVGASVLANANAGNLDAAGRFVAQMRTLNPKLTISGIPAIIPFRRAEDMERTMHGFRLAGLPE